MSRNSNNDSASGGGKNSEEFLSKEYLDLLENAQEIRSQAALFPRHQEIFFK
jgi:hypothetical protein